MKKKTQLLNDSKNVFKLNEMKPLDNLSKGFLLRYVRYFRYFRYFRYVRYVRYVRYTRYRLSIAIKFEWC